MEIRFEKLAEKFVGLCAIALGIMFLYVPLFDFLQNESRQKEFSETEKADIRSIHESQNQAALTEAVNRLMARPDISRVHVLKGEYEYPAFEIKLGKNSRPGEIERHVNQNEKGFWIYIGYNTSLKPSIGPEREIKETIKALGSAVGGVFLVVVGLMNLAGVSSKSDHRLDEKRPTLSSPLTPESKQVAPERVVPESIKYGGLKLVKSGNEKARPA